MPSENEQVKGPAKGIRVSTHTHALIKQHMHRMHAESMEQALATILGDSALHIPMPADVLERWEAEARESGFPLPQWVAQRVEGYLANRAYAGEVRRALNELMALRKSMTMPGLVHDIFGGEMPPRPRPETFMPCQGCKTPEACAGGNRQHRDCP